MQLSSIRIQPQLAPTHEQALLNYLDSTRSLSSADWSALFDAVELLDQSTLFIDRITYTFRQFYNQFIDKRFADSFITQLVQLTDLEKATVLQASVAQQIMTFLQGLSGFSPQQKTHRLLMVYCLYWWAAFARGYIFEQEVLRDLTENEIEFAAHDITIRQERFSAYDLVVAELRGDIKSTTYFLTKNRRIVSATDFFITRAYSRLEHKWRMVVVMRNHVWRQLNGDTIPTSLNDLTSVLPQAASIEIGNEQLIITEYDDWKDRIRHNIQSKGEN